MMGSLPFLTLYFKKRYRKRSNMRLSRCGKWSKFTTVMVLAQPAVTPAYNCSSKSVIKMRGIAYVNKPSLGLEEL
jgi:hypothetical protein